MPPTISKIAFTFLALFFIAACDNNTTPAADSAQPADSVAADNAATNADDNLLPSGKAPMGKLPDDPLAQMRIMLKPYWAPISSGGIILLADIEDETLNVAAFSRLLKLFPNIEGADNNAWMPLSKELAKLSLDFTRKAEIELGVYELKNYHKTYADEGKLYFDEKDGAPIGLPDAEILAFEMTDEHVKLIRHMNVRDLDGNVELMDVLQPYVGNDDLYRAMAMALDDEIPADAEVPMENRHYYDILQREMIFAVQTFWTHAKMPGEEKSPAEAAEAENSPAEATPAEMPAAETKAI